MYPTGSHKNFSKLISGIVIYSTSEADYVGYLNNPCDMVDSIELYIDCVTGEGPCTVCVQLVRGEPHPALRITGVDKRERDNHP